MKTVINGMKIPLTCPECSHEFKKAIRWLDEHRKFPCPGCGVDFVVNGDEFREIRKQFDALSKHIANLNKTLKP